MAEVCQGERRGAARLLFPGQESGTYQWQRLWSGQQFDQSLAKLAEKSLHPEVATAPIAMWGLSAGGQFTYNFACWKPERLVAFGISKGGHNFLDASPATLRLPGLFIVAAHDMGERVTNLTGLFTDGRRSGAPWCLVLEPGVGTTSAAIPSWCAPSSGKS